MYSKILSLTIMTVMSTIAYAEGCQYDTQCKGNRVCQSGSCIAPESPSKSTNVSKPKRTQGDSLSSTCEFSSGPKAGQVMHWPRSTPGLRPTKVGMPCTDGMGSAGTAIQDEE